ncbi:MAG: hypothetical protein L0Y68_06460 [Candidatus Dadabacteria bacterium]|nr:hypothetical protein [Candidatus Dadabacteria bacterium]
MNRIILNPHRWRAALVTFVLFISCSIGDTSPPAPIEDLSFDMTTRQLNWTATGDDGNRGTATIYDLRFSSEPNVAEDFANATHIEDLPRPFRAGDPQFFLLPRLDVTGTLDFFFALDVRDEVGNNSGPSNVVELTTPLVALELENSADGSCFGESVGAGDFNGDEINDIAVGDPCLGMVFLFFGSSELIAGVLDASFANVTIIGNADDRFGASVAGIGNIGGGILETLAIGAPGFSGDTGQVFTVSGSTRLPLVIDFTIGDVPEALVTGENMGDEFGASIAGLVGVEGGNTLWTLVGAPGASSETGQAYLFRSRDLRNTSSASQAKAIFAGEVAGGMFGFALTQVGDLNEDNFSEFAIGAPEGGQAFVIFGSNDISVDVSMVIINGNASDGFASSISSGEDVDGDGLPDLLVGASATNMDTGSVFLFSGEEISIAESTGGSPSAETEFTGEAQGDMFGTSVAILGDINPEISEVKRASFFVLELIPTNPDFAIGAPGTGEGGSVYVFFGVDDGFPPVVPASDADITPITGMSQGFADDEFGSIVLGAGDISFDLINDIVATGLGFARAEF